jgi:guanine nucleotide-binding protein G(i) subunit alpha
MEMDYSLASPDVRRTAQYIHTLELPQPLDVYIFQVAPAIQSLWLDPAVQATFRRSREFQLVDSASYLFDRMPAMATKGWLPTDQDMLRVRIKTTGIQELHFTIKEAEYAIFDVGGQKSERRKWLSVFENVDVLRPSILL